MVMILRPPAALVVRPLGVVTCRMRYLGRLPLLLPGRCPVWP